MILGIFHSGFFSWFEIRDPEKSHPEVNSAKNDFYRTPKIFILKKIFGEFQKFFFIKTIFDEPKYTLF